MTIQDLESQFTSGVYTKRPIALVRGAGAHVWDSDGVEYIDCVGGQGSVNVGHANPAVAEAIARRFSTTNGPLDSSQSSERSKHRRAIELFRNYLGPRPAVRFHCLYRRSGTH